jgi:hypothetical protein
VQGSTFTLYLPIDVRRAGAHALPAVRARAGRRR